MNRAHQCSFCHNNEYFYFLGTQCHLTVCEEDSIYKIRAKFYAAYPQDNSDNIIWRKTEWTVSCHFKRKTCNQFKQNCIKHAKLNTKDRLKMKQLLLKIKIVFQKSEIIFISQCCPSGDLFLDKTLTENGLQWDPADEVVFLWMFQKGESNTCFKFM